MYVDNVEFSVKTGGVYSYHCAGNGCTILLPHAGRIILKCILKE
jgi:hypothetical protein